VTSMSSVPTRYAVPYTVYRTNLYATPTVSWTVISALTSIARTVGFFNNLNILSLDVGFYFPFYLLLYGLRGTRTRLHSTMRLDALITSRYSFCICFVFDVFLGQKLTGRPYRTQGT
jgi:hypothetical protein